MKSEREKKYVDPYKLTLLGMRSLKDTFVPSPRGRLLFWFDETFSSADLLPPEVQNRDKIGTS